MRVTLKFAKLFGTRRITQLTRSRCGDIELQSQGYMVQKYGIVSVVVVIDSHFQRSTVLATEETTVIQPLTVHPSPYSCMYGPIVLLSTLVLSS